MTCSEPYRVPAPGEAADPVWTPAELDRLAARRKGTEATRRRKDIARARWALLNGFVDAGMAGLELSDMAVWLVLFRHARADGAATVARTEIVRRVGCDKKTVTAALRRLMAAGWLVRLRRGGPAGGVGLFRVQNPAGKVGE